MRYMNYTAKVFISASETAFDDGYWLHWNIELWGTRKVSNSWSFISAAWLRALYLIQNVLRHFQNCTPLYKLSSCEMFYSIRQKLKIRLKSFRPSEPGLLLSWNSFLNKRFLPSNKTILTWKNLQICMPMILLHASSMIFRCPSCRLRVNLIRNWKQQQNQRCGLVS